MAFDGVWVSETLRAWCWLEFRSSSVICLVLIWHLSSVELAFLSVKLVPIPQGMLCRLQLSKYADGNISTDLTHTCAWHPGGHSHPQQHTRVSISPSTHTNVHLSKDVKILTLSPDQVNQSTWEVLSNPPCAPVLCLTSVFSCATKFQEESCYQVGGFSHAM